MIFPAPGSSATQRPGAIPALSILGKQPRPEGKGHAVAVCITARKAPPAYHRRGRAVMPGLILYLRDFGGFTACRK